MDILVDSYCHELPEDIRAFAVEAAATEQSIRELARGGPELKMLRGLVPPVVSQIAQLDRWDVQTHKYRQEVAAKVGFLVGLFSGEANRVAAGIVHEAKRYRIAKTNSGRQIEVGVSVRLSVATTAHQVGFDLSIPNVAAQAQLNMAEARIGISVVGFFGPVGDLLPAPEDLNVENFAVFTTAAQAIQKRVFGPDGIEFMSPTVLSFEGPEFK